MTTHVFTIAANNYLPKVRVLLASLRQWHPGWRLHVVVPDAATVELSPAELNADELHYIHELGIPNWRPWAFTHTLIELSTAIKPFALKRLLRRPDCNRVIYLDPDIVVFSELSEVSESLNANDIALTPHLSRPEQTRDGIVANELCASQHGIYNLGFIAVASGIQGRGFADWWSQRLYHFCREDIEDGIYTDQRWIDLVPGFFERVAILRATRLNVAPWNISTRNLEGSLSTGFTVDRAPLGFYHFSRVGSEANDSLIATCAAATELTRWYRSELLNQFVSAAQVPWTLGSFSDGAPILPEQRLVYRLRSDLRRSFANPFEHGPNTFIAWWHSHAKREYPQLFRPSTRVAELKWLRYSLIYGRTGTEVETEFAQDIGRYCWLDEALPQEMRKTRLAGFTDMRSTFLGFDRPLYP